MFDDLRFWALLFVAAVGIGFLVPGLLHSAPPSDETIPNPTVEAAPAEPQTQEPPAPEAAAPAQPAEQPAPAAPAETVDASSVPWNDKCAAEAAYWPNVLMPIWNSDECQNWYAAMGVDGKGPIEKP